MELGQQRNWPVMLNLFAAVQILNHFRHKRHVNFKNVAFIVASYSPEALIQLGQNFLQEEMGKK